MKGKLVAIESFDHVPDQIVRHARLVARELGFTDAHIEFYAGGAANMNEIVEDAKQALGEVNCYVLGGLWFEHKFMPTLDLLKCWLDQNRIVFVRNYVTRVAAQLAFEENLVGDAAIQYAEWFCRQAHRRYGLPEVDVGVIISDPRLDAQIVQYGNTEDGYEFRPQKISSKTEAERNVLIASTKDDPRWSCIQAGIPELTINDDGIPFRKENESLRREYWEIEQEAIRLIIPGTNDITDEAIANMLEEVRFRLA